MFNRRHLEVKLVKDAPTTELPDAGRINSMTKEEAEELSRVLMKRIAVHVGAVIVVKITVAVALGVIAKKLESSN